MAVATTNIQFKIKDLFNKGKNFIWNLNLFVSTPPTQDALTLRKQHFSTRLLLLLFIFCLIIFTTYTSQVFIYQTIRINNPSYSLYKELFDKYSYKLSCPCTTIAILNKNFLQINVSYHEFCSSIFYPPRWSDQISRSKISNLLSIEFRGTGAAFFQMLSVISTLAGRLVGDELLDFANASFISANVMPFDIFNEQVMSSVDLLISNLENNFMSLISLIRTATNANGDTSGLLTNFDYTNLPFNEVHFQAAPTPRTFLDTNCTCFGTTVCIIPAFITSDG